MPNALDVLLARRGTEREDPAQARYVEVVAANVPGGAILGEIRLLVAPPSGDYSVIVFAFDVTNPPPPHGGGRPVATAIVPKTAFGSMGTAMYALGGIATGTYVVRAFLDADDDFTPWFDTMNQPERGDIGGGHLDLNTGALRTVSVNALGAPSAGIDVSIVGSATIAIDRPMFAIDPDRDVLDLSGTTLFTRLSAISEHSNVLDQDGVFPIQWVDLDRSGVAEDINQDQNPDVFPIVIAELLDPTDPTSSKLAEPRVRIPGFVSPLQFQPLGFPATDPTQVSAVVIARELDVAFPVLPVPAGKYRITLINGGGQTWSIPNELSRATGTALVQTQGGYLTVEE